MVALDEARYVGGIFLALGLESLLAVLFLLALFWLPEKEIDLFETQARLHML